MDENLDVRRLKALEEDWSELPLTETLVASYLGFKPKKKGNAADLLAMFPGGVIK